MAETNYSVQGCVPVRRLRNNDSLSISIESTQPLFQGVDANNDNATPFLTGKLMMRLDYPYSCG